MKIRILLFLSLLVLPLSLHAQDLNIYWLMDLEEIENKKVGYVSLSDSYPLSNHPDSLAIPDFYSIHKENRAYFKLDQKYRKRVLSKTKISETDSLFAYDYSTNALRSFLIRDLNAIAYLDNYKNIDNCHPCDQDDYRIGFEINKSLLDGLGNSYQHTLVYVGKENPFALGQMKAIVWKKIKKGNFPMEKSNLTETQKRYKHKNVIEGQAYLYETDNYQIFIQDYTGPNNLVQVQDRHLIIIDKQKGNVVNESMFNNSEGTSVAPLNYGINNSHYPDLKEQWTGKLFKDKPEVIFGFEWVSFGCPGLILIDSVDNVFINCDNRH